MNSRTRRNATLSFDVVTMNDTKDTRSHFLFASCGVAKPTIELQRVVEFFSRIFNNIEKGVLPSHAKKFLKII